MKPPYPVDAGCKQGAQNRLKRVTTANGDDAIRSKCIELPALERHAWAGDQTVGVHDQPIAAEGRRQPGACGDHTGYVRRP